MRVKVTVQAKKDYADCIFQGRVYSGWYDTEIDVYKIWFGSEAMRDTTDQGWEWFHAQGSCDYFVRVEPTINDIWVAFDKLSMAIHEAGLQATTLAKSFDDLREALVKLVPRGFDIMSGEVFLRPLPTGPTKISHEGDEVYTFNSPFSVTIYSDGSIQEQWDYT